ncbi:MAG: hypothetical protein QME81_11240 [bacterium]|nr:hypothetical protein [bacterium]
MRRILFCFIFVGLLIGASPVWAQIYGLYQSPIVLKPGQVEGGARLFFMEDIDASGILIQGRFSFNENIDWGLTGGFMDAKFISKDEDKDVGFFIGGDGKYQLLTKKKSDVYLSLGARFSVTKADEFSSFSFAGFTLVGDTVMINRKKSLTFYTGLGLDVRDYEKTTYNNKPEDGVEIDFFLPIGVKYWLGEGFSVSGEITLSETASIGGGINIYL